MSLSRPLSSVLFAAALLAPLVGGRTALAAPVVAEGPRVRVDADAGEQRTVEKAKAVVEATLALAEAALPYKLPATQKIVVHLYADGAAFADANRIAGDDASNDLSTTGAKSRESRVIVAPRSEPGYLLLVDDLPELTRYHVAFETIVQLLRRAEAPSLDFWPAWYGQGLCDRLAFDALTPASGPAPILVDDMASVVHEAARTGRLLPVTRLLWADAVVTPFVRRFQAHWIALHRVLAAEPEKLTKLHEAIRNLPVLAPPAEGERDHRALATAHACARLLGEVYGAPETLDPKLLAHANGLAPRWFDVLRWSQFSGDELVCGSPAGSTAVAVRETLPPGGPFAVECEMRLADVGAGDDPKKRPVPQGEIYLGYERRDDPRFLKLSLRADGFVTLLVLSDGLWQERLRVNLQVDASTFPVGAWIPVRVVTDGRLIRLDVRGAKLFEAPVPEGFDVLHGRVAFGAFSSVVRFQKIAVVPVEPEKPATGK